MAHIAVNLTFIICRAIHSQNQVCGDAAFFGGVVLISAGTGLSDKPEFSVTGFLFGFLSFLVGRLLDGF